MTVFAAAGFNAGMQTRLRLQFGNFAPVFAVLFALDLLCQAQAQVIVTSSPANGATGVSPNTTVVFTFSAPVLPSTTAMFIAGSIVPATPVWNGNFTSVTYTPNPAFPAGVLITWVIQGTSQVGQPVSSFGSFTTSSGGGGSGTNAITFFSLAKLHGYLQTSTNIPVLETNAGLAFGASVTLASNRTATSIQVTLPTSAVSNLTQNPSAPEDFSMIAMRSNVSSLDASFPSGNYSFLVQAPTSNQTVIVNFPAAMQQPPAPRIANFTAAQAVDAAQPFVLTWDAFAGGSAADGIYVQIGDAFHTIALGLPGALTGTSTAVTIPAGTLQAGTTYDGWITFERFTTTVPNATYATGVQRATGTRFTLVTAAPTLVLTNAALSPANYSFDVLCSTGQTVTVQYRTNLAVGTWQTLFTTNSPVNRFRAVAPQATTNRTLFFRAKNGT